MFKNSMIVLPYVIGTLAIIGGYFFNSLNSYIILTICLLLLLIWDLIYVFHKNSFEGRTVQETNDSVTRARTYVSWYLGIYSVVIGLIFTSTSNMLEIFKLVLNNSQISVFFISLPLLISLVSMLFVPISLSYKNEYGIKKPNTALKLLFLMVVFSQKSILILIGHIGVRIVNAWSSL